MFKCVFLDMDGVLVDFNKGIHAVHNRQDIYQTNFEMAKGKFHLAPLWGISKKEFWEPTLTPGFWESLDKTPEADDIVKHFQHSEVCILTTPSVDKNCVPEKRNWMRNHYPHLAKNMIFTDVKKFLAGPGRCLLDDKDENVNEFDSNGGFGLILPRPWNRLYMKQMKNFNYSELIKANDDR